MTAAIRWGLLAMFAANSYAGLFYIVTDNDSFEILNTASGAITPIGSASSAASIAFDPLGNLDTLSANSNPSNLLRVNVNTANTSLIAASTQQFQGGFTSYSGGALYTAAGGNLYTIDPTTAAGTLVGSLQLPSVVPTPPSGFSSIATIQIVFGPSGVLYLLAQTGCCGQTTDFLFSVNTSTGQATEIGAVGPDLLSTIFFGDGILYGAGKGSSGVGHNLYSINVATGAETLVETFGQFNVPYSTEIVSAVEIPGSTTPEPGQFPILCVALVSLEVFRRSRQKC